VALPARNAAYQSKGAALGAGIIAWIITGAGMFSLANYTCITKTWQSHDARGVPDSAVPRTVR
jgi:hypothetical protein